MELGGGIEKKLSVLIAIKFHVRDYATRVPHVFYEPCDAWHWGFTIEKMVSVIETIVSVIETIVSVIVTMSSGLEASF